MPTNPAKVLITLIQQKRFTEAATYISPLLKANKNNVQLWHLYSVILHGLNDLKKCENALTRALELNADFPPALANLALLKKQNGQLDAAAVLYEQLAKITPKDVNVLLNLGVLYNKTRQFSKATNILQQALSYQNDNVNIKIALGQSYLYQEDLERAHALFAEVLQQDPNNIAALNNLGIVLKTKCLFEQAITTFTTALELTPNKPELQKNLASCYTLIGDISNSKKLYQTIIEQNPLDLDAHHWLNQMLWEHQDDSFLTSYQLAIKTNKHSPQLQFALAHKLRQSGENDKAQEILADVIKVNKKHVPSLLEIANIYREKGDFNQSLDCLLLANKSESSNAEVKQELAKGFISINEPKKALSLLNKLLTLAPNHQGYWAYKTTALRLQNSAEYDYLCDYDKFILKAFIDVPEGYSDLSSFNQELAAALKSIHHGTRHPLDQTLISGSQTSEKLFDYQLPIIKKIKQSLQQQTREFLAQLPKDPKHPMLCRNTLNFTETDSWSVILNNSGFHKNHYHPAGWYSSSYYVKVPSSVNNTTLKQGWINFGQPGFNMQTSLDVEISIEPKEGLIVQFPSYFWHGTNPFSSDEQRITTPYDILPL